MVHCAYAFMLSVSSIYMAISTPKAESTFFNALDNEQQLTYQEIRNERLQIYMQSLLIGILAGAVHYNYKKDICYFWAIALTITSMMYMVMPKSKRMIDYMKTKEQHVALSDLHSHQRNSGMMSSFVALAIWFVAKSR